MIETATPTKARNYALQASAAMLVAVVFASITFNIFGYPLTFILAPFIVLFLWPNGADPVISYFGIFVTSLILDVLLGDPLGGWPLIFLPFYVLMVFFGAGRDTGFGETWLNFVFWMVAFIGFFALGKVVRFIDVDLPSLLKLGVMTIILFPLVYFVKSQMRNVLVSEDGA